MDDQLDHTRYMKKHDIMEKNNVASIKTIENKTLLNAQEVQLAIILRNYCSKNLTKRTTKFLVIQLIQTNL